MQEPDRAALYARLKLAGLDEAPVHRVVEPLGLIAGGDEQTVAATVDDLVDNDVGGVHQGPLLTGHTGFWIAIQIGVGVGLAALSYRVSRLA